MDEKEILKKLEEEYVSILGVVKTATDPEARSTAMRKLDLIHKHLVEERKALGEKERYVNDYILKNQQHQEDLEFKEKELELKLEQVESEERIKTEQLKGEKHNRIVGWVLTGIGTATSIVSLVLTNRWMKDTMKFEETGTFTSRSGKFVSDIKRLFNKG